MENQKSETYKFCNILTILMDYIHYPKIFKPCRQIQDCDLSKVVYNIAQREATTHATILFHAIHWLPFSCPEKRIHHAGLEAQPYSEVNA